MAVIVLVLHDQQREEEGFYNSKGVWTVRGKVSWLNPSETLNQTILYQADDKGYQVKSSVEELSRKPGRPGESDLPVGPGRPEFPSQPSRPGVPAYPSLPPSYPSQPPSYPSQPPSYPSQPPSYPGTPGYPGAPSAPGYPGSPGGPGYPGFAPPINCGLASICG
ncbi:unnamed protein product [Nezara viridula]|uniref:Cuticular protein n=1 Tax=Nezara viridula TaxID=85310 RepID=A0A9P0DVS1_NEZVI|nr:unnamed protein product [Nezara viridula]